MSVKNESTPHFPWSVTVLLLGLVLGFFGMLASLGWAESYKATKPCTEVNSAR